MANGPTTDRTQYDADREEQLRVENERLAAEAEKAQKQAEAAQAEAARVEAAQAEAAQVEAGLEPPLEATSAEPEIGFSDDDPADEGEGGRRVPRQQRRK